MRSLASLARAQAARTVTLPSQAVAPQPAREAMLETLRERNAVLDALFYDLGALAPDTAAMLAPRYAAEGAILRVEPGRDGAVSLFPDFDTWRVSGRPRDGRAIVVAGVGSSALGAAAFARNVADAIEAPVLAVVSGYGLADIVSEAAGGWFLFGWLNALRGQFELLDDISRPSNPRFGGPAGALVQAVRRSLDVRTLTALAAAAEVPLLVGHSKGNLVIAEALAALAEADPALAAARARATCIVTVSARVAMPRPFGPVIDVMGTLDTFGMLNSRPDIPIDVPVHGAWHHTNTELPFHLGVTGVLSRLFARD